MFNDKDFTNKRIYSILNLINNSTNPNEIKETFDLIFTIFSLEDNYSLYRYETIIGLPQIQFKINSNRIFSFHNNLNSNNKILSIDNNQCIKFISTIFPNEETIFEKMFNRWKNNTDFIDSISKIYTLIYINPIFFRYFNSLPHPKNLNKKLNDYLEENIREEVNHFNNYSIKKYDNEVMNVQNYMNNYDIKEIELKQKFDNENEFNINFLPRKDLGKICNETITNIILPLNEENGFENPNDNGIFLLRSDVEIIVGDFIIQKNIENYDNIQNENNKNINNN